MGGLGGGGLMVGRGVPGLVSTTVIGSYPQPSWLVDIGRLKEHIVPRARADDIWRVAPAYLKQAQDDATVLAIREMEQAGIDTITDGEIRRESYSNRFIQGLEGVDVDQPAKIEPIPGMMMDVPRVTGALRRVRPIEVEDMRFLRANTERLAKITLPGPFTLAAQAADEFYHDSEALAMAFADVVNEEARALQAAGADVIQLDEPWLRSNPAGARRYAVAAIDRAFAGITVTRAVHLCFGYAWIQAGTKPKAYPFLEQLVESCVDQISVEAAQPGLDLTALRALRGKTIILGVLDLASPVADTAEQVAGRLRAALPYVAADRLVGGPDCGMKYMARELAMAKLRALAAGAAIVRQEVGG